MAVINPSQSAVDALVDRLSSSVDGLNVTYNSNAPAYGIPATLDINFTELKSPNFIYGDVSLGDWEQTSARKYPLVAVYSSRVLNSNIEKFHTFSGPVVVGLTVYLTWKGGNVQRDFDFYAQAMEGAVLTIVNRSRSEFSDDQDWGAEVTYNGDVELTKSSIVRGSHGWVQELRFLFTFQVDADI